MKIQKEHPLKYLNSFNVPASARYFTEVEKIENLQQLLSESVFKENSHLILGGGSNILFSKNYNGLVILNKIGGINILMEDEENVLISAGGGEIWDDLVTFCINRNLGGIENLALIPGTVGAAPIQNIGAYGVELKDSFHSLKAISLKSGEEIEFNQSDCEFGYRDSIFKSKVKGEFFIYEVVLRLSKNPTLNISYSSLLEEFEISGEEKLNVILVSELVKQVRRSKLPEPSEIGNAGSFFKNPEVDELIWNQLQTEYPDLHFYKLENNSYKIPAGWLIEKCGLKGYRSGNVGTYPNQALVIVNYGAESGEEIIKFAEMIKSKVMEKFQIELKPEVNII